MCFGECILIPTCYSFSFHNHTNQCMFFRRDRCSLDLIPSQGATFFDSYHVTKLPNRFKLISKSSLEIGFTDGMIGLRFQFHSSLSIRLTRCIMFDVNGACLYQQGNMVDRAPPPGCSSFNLIPVGDYYIIKILQTGMCLSSTSAVPTDGELVGVVDCDETKDNMLFWVFYDSM